MIMIPRRRANPAALGAAAAHGLVGRSDLPVPAWLFAWGASIVLIVSFFALSVAWRQPRFEEERLARPRRRGLSRVCSGCPRRSLCGAIGVFLLGLRRLRRPATAPKLPIATSRSPSSSSPAGSASPLLSVLFGDVFRAFNPWRAVGRACGGRSARSRPAARAPRLPRTPRPLAGRDRPVGVRLARVVYGASGGVAVGLDPDDADRGRLVYTAYTLAMMACSGSRSGASGARSSRSTSGCSPSSSIFGVRDGRIGAAAASWPARRTGRRPAGSAAVVIASIALDQLRRRPGGSAKGRRSHRSSNG